MKRPTRPCATPMCDGRVTFAATCRRCYEARRAQTPERKAWARKYARRPYVQKMKAEACKDYYDAGKNRGVCCVCGGETADKRALRCLPCYRAQVLPRAGAKGLAKIHGRPNV